MSDKVWPPAATLQNAHVRVEPLSLAHTEDLQEAAADLGQLWYTWVPTPEGMKADIEQRLAKRAAGSMLPFAVLTSNGRAVGMTTYMNVDAANRRVEIGSTWYAKSVQRSGLNTACKLLLLEHAFEALDCIAVEFRTHRLNVQSRRAIERLGAQFDGLIRAHMVMANGTIRDTAVYSVTAPEWPAVKANLEWLAKPRA